MTAITHLVIGMAAAMTVLVPGTTATVIPVIAGSALGSLICDLDCRAEPAVMDAFFGRLIAAGIIGLTVFMDLVLGSRIWASLLNPGRQGQIIGILLFLLVCVFVRYSPHRGFSHSLLALALEAAVLRLVMKEAVPAFSIAYVSHLLLDILNKRPVRILFPLKKGFRLGWFYVNRRADKTLLFLGAVWLTAISVYCAGAW